MSTPASAKFLTPYLPAARRYLLALATGICTAWFGSIAAPPAHAFSAADVDPGYTTQLDELQGFTPGQNPASYGFFFDTAESGQSISSLGFAIFNDWNAGNYDVYLWRYVGDLTSSSQFTELAKVTFNVANKGSYVSKGGYYWIDIPNVNLGVETLSDDNVGFAVAAVGNFSSATNTVPFLFDGTGSFSPQFVWDGNGFNGPLSSLSADMPVPLDYYDVNPLNFYGFFNANFSSEVPGPLPLMGVAAAFGWSRRIRRRIKSFN